MMQRSIKICSWAQEMQFVLQTWDMTRMWTLSVVAVPVVCLTAWEDSQVCVRCNLDVLASSRMFSHEEEKIEADVFVEFGSWQMLWSPGWCFALSHSTFDCEELKWGRTCLPLPTPASLCCSLVPSSLSISLPSSCCCSSCLYTHISFPKITDSHVSCCLASFL